MPRKKRSSFGSVAKLANDRWRLRWWEGGKRRTEIVHGTRREADDRLARIRVDVGSEPKRRATVEQAYERWWLPELRQRVEAGEMSARTLANVESAWSRHVAPRFGSLDVEAVEPLDVREFLRGLSVGQAKQCRVVLFGVLDECEALGIVSRNAARTKVRMPKSTLRETDDAAWSVEELEGVWRAVRGSFCEPAVILSAFGSARVGESLAVMGREVERVETPHGVVAVAPIVRQMGNTTNELSDVLKTPTSARALVIPGPMGQRLLALADESGGGWLTDRGDACPSTQDGYRREFARLLDEAGVVRHPAKNLRKSWETMAKWTLEIPPAYVEPLMGHVEPGVTARHYDRPKVADFAMVVAQAYAAHPFADRWDI